MLYGPGNWTLPEIRRAPAMTVYRHIVLSQRAEAEQKQSQIMLSVFSKMEKGPRRKLMAALKRQSNFGRRLTKATSLVDDKTRILMIGSELTVHGQKWARLNPEEIAWLKEQGISEIEAMRRHREWLEAEMRHPFWTPAAKPRRS